MESDEAYIFAIGYHDPEVIRYARRKNVCKVGRHDSNYGFNSDRMMNHNCLVSNNDIIIGGYIEKRGNLLQIDNHSGHYHPKKTNSEYLLDLIQKINPPSMK
jgi:hypothetical protein